MFSLFYDIFIAVPAPRVLSFVWENALFYREVKLFLTFSEMFFKLQGYRLNNATVCETPILKIFKLLEKAFSSLTIHRKFS